MSPPPSPLPLSLPRSEGREVVDFGTKSSPPPSAFLAGGGVRGEGPTREGRIEERADWTS